MHGRGRQERGPRKAPRRARVYGCRVALPGRAPGLSVAPRCCDGARACTEHSTDAARLSSAHPLSPSTPRTTVSGQYDVSRRRTSPRARCWFSHPPPLPTFSSIGESLALSVGPCRARGGQRQWAHDHHHLHPLSQQPRPGGWLLRGGMGRGQAAALLLILSSPPKISGYIDYANRLKSDDMNLYFSGKKRFMPRPTDLR